jgi:hypothetical protein
MSRPIVVITYMFGSSDPGGLNSAHIHGTHVPVEEPSTASRAVIQRLISFSVFAYQSATGSISAESLSVSELSLVQFSGQLVLNKEGFKALDVPSMQVPPWRDRPSGLTGPDNWQDKRKRSTQFFWFQASKNIASLP